MPHTIFIPKLGLTMTEGTIVEWPRTDGERVAKGETVVTIETDKVTFDVEAEHDGFLQRVARQGATLPVGGLVGYLHPSAEAAMAMSHADDASAPVTTAAAVAAIDPASAMRHPASLTVTAKGTGQRLMISPVARKVATAHGLDPASIAGSGPGGVILKRDVDTAVLAAPERQPISAAVAPTEIRRPLSSMRKTISRRMMQSLSTTAQMTGFGKVDMAEATKLRSALVAVADNLGVRITFTDIALKAAATALTEMPEINSSIDGNEIVTRSAVNIGFAVALDDGLIVPVIHHVDRLSLVELSNARRTLIDKARAGDLASEDVEGGTFTLSNFGSYGGDFETPILNPPQSALLGIGQITDEAVVRDGQIVIRPMMAVSLTVDHRLIDGALAGRFRARFKALLEEPALLLARMR